METIEMVNNFIKSIPTTNKQSDVVRTLTEGGKVYYIASVNGNKVAECILTENESTEKQLNASLQRMVKNPIFVTPNIKSYNTYTEC